MLVQKPTGTFSGGYDLAQGEAYEQALCDAFNRLGFRAERPRQIIALPFTPWKTLKRMRAKGNVHAFMLRKMQIDMVVRIARPGKRPLRLNCEVKTRTRFYDPLHIGLVAKYQDKLQPPRKLSEYLEHDAIPHVPVHAVFVINEADGHVYAAPPVAQWKVCKELRYPYKADDYAISLDSLVEVETRLEALVSRL